jgi:hypothetical protein
MIGAQYSYGLGAEAPKAYGSGSQYSYGLGTRGIPKHIWFTASDLLPILVQWFADKQKTKFC